MKKKGNLKFLLLMLLITGCVSCVIDSADVRLSVHNNSKINIYVQDDIDTVTLSPHADIGFMLPQYFIKSGDSLRIKSLGNKKAWESTIERAPDKKLHLYVFSEDTLNKYTTEQIIAGKRYLQRIDMTLEDLKASDWKIFYTGEKTQ